VSDFAPIIFIAILALGAFLIALPRLLARRDARRTEAPPEPRRPRPTATGLKEPPTLEEIEAQEAVVEEAVEEPEAAEAIDVVEDAEVIEAEAIEVEAPPEPPRMGERLGKTRATFAGLVGRFRRGGKIDDDAWDDLEETLLLADVGMTTTEAVVTSVRERATGADAAALPDLLREELTARLDGDGRDRALNRADAGPSVWLLVGVNGVGKTTTAAKLAKREQAEGRRVLLAAADTFRAAAADQLGTWADRLGCELVRGQDGGDPGAVVFDAIDAAAARDVDVVLVDTAGRLHTKVHLMRELEKLKRIVERRPGALQEVLLVLDASTGQNGLVQAREFAEAVEITGVVLTKLDGTAKGGVVLAIEEEFGVPVKLVGLGEGADDLVPFDAAEFAAALVG
jgi:fused signal recognition particle receptor